MSIVLHSKVQRTVHLLDEMFALTITHVDELPNFPIIA